MHDYFTLDIPTALSEVCLNSKIAAKLGQSVTTCTSAVNSSGEVHFVMKIKLGGPVSRRVAMMNTGTLWWPRCAQRSRGK